MKKTIQNISTLLLITLLTACQGVPQKSEFVINPKINTPFISDKSNKSIAISIVKASPTLHRKEMGYNRSPNQIEYFSKSSWAMPPSKMMQYLFIQAFTQSNAYSDVVGLPNDIKTTLRLDLNLIKMYHYFDSDASNHVEVELQARLIDPTTHKIYFSKSYRDQEIGKENNAISGVEAYNRAFERIIPEILTDVNHYR